MDNIFSGVTLNGMIVHEIAYNPTTEYNVTPVLTRTDATKLQGNMVTRPKFKYVRSEEEPQMTSPGKALYRTDNESTMTVTNPQLDSESYNLSISTEGGALKATYTLQEDPTVSYTRDCKVTIEEVDGLPTFKISNLTKAYADYQSGEVGWNYIQLFENKKPYEGADISELINQNASLHIDNNTTNITVGMKGDSTQVIKDGRVYSLQDKGENVTDKLKLVVQDSYAATDVSLKTDEDNQKVFITVSGTYIDGAETDLKNLLTNTEKFGFDLQRNPYATEGLWNGDGIDWSRNEVKPSVVTVKNGEFSVDYDVTDIKNYYYTMHFGKITGGKAADIKIDNLSIDGWSITFNEKVYELVNKHGSSATEDFYGCIGLKIYGVYDGEYKNTYAELSKEGDKLYLTVSGTYRNYTDDEIKAIVSAWGCDIQKNANATPNDGSWKKYEEEIDIAEQEVGNGNYSVKIDVSAILENQNKQAYIVHFGPKVEDKYPDLVMDPKWLSSESVTINNCTFALGVYTGWGANLVTIYENWTL